MALQVIGAGLGRTGTMTLKLALEELGLGPCHHMIEVFRNPQQAPFWKAAADGKTVDWDAGFTGYTSTVDWPSAYFYKELAAHFPEAKVILTRRDTQRWYESISQTILKALPIMAANPNWPADDPGRFSDIIVRGHTFNHDLSEANVKAAYDRHNDEVIRAIPADRLLVFQATDGWAPLCRFLGVAEPSTPFPRSNSRDEFWTHIPPDVLVQRPG